MGTVNQPKPTPPKSPEPAQRPLQPGQTTASSPDQKTPQRVHPQIPEPESERKEHLHKERREEKENYETE
jgi:hypothetical protein